jgi:hypothetical protein
VGESILSELKINGNNKTNLMHLYTFNELNKMHLNHELKIKRIQPEQTVLIHSKTNSFVSNEGRFDFLVETKENKLIGMEVLTRPTKGKMKSKLRYAQEADEFIFVLPSNSMEFYRKPKKVFHKKAKRKFFGKEFSGKNLFVWLLDLRKGLFTEKKPFSEVFNVKQKTV